MVEREQSKAATCPLTHTSDPTRLQPLPCLSPPANPAHTLQDVRWPPYPELWRIASHGRGPAFLAAARSEPSRTAHRHSG